MVFTGASGGRGSYFSCADGVEPRPLYMCLGDLGGKGSPESASASAEGGSGGVCEVLGGHYLLNFDTKLPLAPGAFIRNTFVNNFWP